MDLTPRCYIWIIAVFLFTSTLSGGTFLALYLTQPESPATSSYPIIGITLVCLPWFFWFLTVLYRIISRSLGFRMVCWGKTTLPANNSMLDCDAVAPEAACNADAAFDHGSENNAAATSSSKGDASKQVRFGDSVPQSDNNHNHLGYGGSNSSSASHESELPLKMSMV